MKKGELKIERSSGNVFADGGHPDPDTALMKANLVSRISDAVEARGLTQAAASKLLGIDQPKMSKLLNGHLREFSLERLMQFLALLGNDVDVVVHARRRSRGRGRVKVLTAA